MKKMFFIIICILLIKSATALSQGTLNINVIEGNDCILYFKQGWNFFSFCSELQNNDIKNVLSPIENKYRYVMKWNKTMQEYELFSPQASENPFTTFDDNESYFIYVWENADLFIQEPESGLETRNLAIGWTAPSYPYRQTKTIRNMYSSIIRDLRYIMKWNSDAQEFELYSPIASENPFNEINKGDGQFVYMWTEQTLRY